MCVFTSRFQQTPEAEAGSPGSGIGSRSARLIFLSWGIFPGARPAVGASLRVLGGRLATDRAGVVLW